MRSLPLALCLAAVLAASAVADDKKKEDTKKAKLAVGDAAPALKADQWLSGDEVKSFEKGKVYVVEFWATWCAPCVVMMPHLSVLQREYKGKGVTFIGYTAKDATNTQDRVSSFVKQRWAKLDLTFAWSAERDTWDAYMKAAGKGTPCCFVVDKAGKVAFVGHPLFLDAVLPQVVDGTWKVESAAEETKKLEKQLDAVLDALDSTDTAAKLKAIRQFEKANPKLTNIPFLIRPKLSVLLKAKEKAEAKRFAERVIARATKHQDAAPLQEVSALLRREDARKEKELVALSVKAAEALLEVSGLKDSAALMNLAESHLAAGNAARAKEYGEKAVENAPAAQKKAMQKRLKQIEEAK